MSLRPQSLIEIPEETAMIAKAAFPKGNTYMRMRDELGPIFADEQFAELYSSRGQPAESPARLALVTVMQFAERFSVLPIRFRSTILLAGILPDSRIWAFYNRRRRHSTLGFVSPIEFEKADALISVSAKSGEFQLVMPGDKFSVLIGDISLIRCINASGLALSQPIYMMNYRSEPLSDFCKDSEYTRC